MQPGVRGRSSRASSEHLFCESAELAAQGEAEKEVCTIGPKRFAIQKKRLAEIKFVKFTHIGSENLGYVKFAEKELQK